MERSAAEQVEDEQEYDETEDDSYMGDAASDVDVEPQSPPWQISFSICPKYFFVTLTNFLAELLVNFIVFKIF